MGLLIDIHCHLDFEGLAERLDEVINNAKKAGLKAVVTSGITPKTNRKALEIASKYDDIVKPSFGLYPIDALRRERKKGLTGEEDLRGGKDLTGKEEEKKKGLNSINSKGGAECNAYDAKPGDEFGDEFGAGFNIDSIDRELEFWDKNRDKFAFIGEVGLDYFNGKDKAMQKTIFERVLETAKKLNKAVIVHSRKAEQDTLDILQSSGVRKVIMHCFSGRKHLIKRAYELGYYFSIPANVVRLQQFQEMAAEIDINHLFCETDSPFLSPFRDKRNEPAFVVESYKKIAELKGITLEETEKNIWMNFGRVL